MQLQGAVFREITVEKAVEYDDFYNNHKPPIALIKANIRGTV